MVSRIKQEVAEKKRRKEYAETAVAIEKEVAAMREQRATGEAERLKPILDEVLRAFLKHATPYPKDKPTRLVLEETDAFRNDLRASGVDFSPLIGSHLKGISFSALCKASATGSAGIISEKNKSKDMKVTIAMDHFLDICRTLKYTQIPPEQTALCALREQIIRGTVLSKK